MEIQKRICQNCGKEFIVDSRKGFSTDSRRILCNDCLEKLDKKDRQTLYEQRRSKKFLEDRLCLSCGITFQVKHNPNAKSTRIRLFCPECTKNLTNYQKKKIRMEADPEYREKVLADKRASHKRNIIHNMWKRAKMRAEKHNYDFNIEESDIIIPETCPLLNIPIFCGGKDDYENSPSLDRIDNSKGYIKGNIWVISKKANSMKNSASKSELNTFIENIKRYSLNITENESNELQDKEPVR